MRPFGFPKEVVHGIAEDGVGGIWAITENGLQYGRDTHGGLYRYQDGKVNKIHAGGGDILVNIAPGVMLAGFHPGSGFDHADLYRVHKEGVAWTEQLLARNQATDTSVDHNGSAIFGCPGGWCELTRRQIVDWPFAGTEVLRHVIPDMNEQRLSRVIRDRFGCVWARTGSIGWVGCDPAKPLTRLPSDFIQVNDYAILLEDPEGKILNLGLSSLVYGRVGSAMHAGAANGVPNDLTAALIAQDGTIWLASSTGVYRFQYPFRLESWNQDDGVEHPDSILRVGDHLLFGGSGIAALDQARRQWNPLRRTQGLGSVMALTPGPGETLYAAASGVGVARLTPEGRVLASSSTAERGLAIATGEDGEVWLGGKGIFRVEQHGRGLLPIRQDLGTESALSLTYDPQRKTLWGCDWHDVVLREHGAWRSATLWGSSLHGLHDNFCQSLALQPNGDIWMAYGGLAEFSLIRNASSSQPEFVNFTSGGEVGDAHASFLSFDRRGWIWRGSDADYVADPSAAQRGEWLRLDTGDGIAVPGGNRNAFFGDQDGSIWFGSANTITHFNPPQGFATDFPVPKISISALSNGNSVPEFFAATAHIPYGGQMVVHIGSLQFDRRNALRLRYRLLPDQPAWQTSRELDLHLGKLRWGRHTLQVQARLASGPWSEVSEESFEVLKPVWLTWPALGSLAAFCAAVAGLSRRWKAKLRERASKRLPDLADLRVQALLPELHQLRGKLLDNRFTVGNLIARGGFASVLAGTDLQQAGRPCAIKIFRSHLMDKTWLPKRFTQEVAALKMVQHPNVVGIYGSGQIPNGPFYLVMEFIEGETLRERMKAGKLPMLLIAKYLRQAGSALGAIHESDICHRDLKPENLMIRNQGEPGQELVLIDFSIAIVKDPDESVYGLTRAAGTLAYMAPEQTIGYAEPSTDIYSLAKVLIEMLAGQSLSELLPDASMDLPRRVRNLLQTMGLPLTSGAIELIGSALEYDPKLRPRDARAFTMRIADDLEDAVPSATS
jgi:tRNA A-37 threonylcarbamoyl transferase component Bud32/ligand-binding sensor domain-containing protein